MVIVKALAYYNTVARGRHPASYWRHGMHRRRRAHAGRSVNKFLKGGRVRLQEERLAEFLKQLKECNALIDAFGAMLSAIKPCHHAREEPLFIRVFISTLVLQVGSEPNVY